MEQLRRIKEYRYGAETVTWLRLLYDYNAGFHGGEIYIWGYFSTDEAQDVFAADSRALIDRRDDLGCLYQEAEDGEPGAFTDALAQLPEEVAAYGIEQTVDEYTANDELRFTEAELDELRRELASLHRRAVERRLNLADVVG